MLIHDSYKIVQYGKANARTTQLILHGSVSASWYNRNTRGKAAFNGVSAITPSISLSWCWA